MCVVKTKALISFAVTAVGLRLCFCIMQIVGFLMRWLNLDFTVSISHCTQQLIEKSLLVV